MTVRIRRIKDGVIFTYTEALANKKGFAAFEDNPKAEHVIPSGGPGETPNLSIANMERADIGKHILNKYGIQIPKLNRKKKHILEDAYKIIDEFTEKEVEDKKEVEAEEAYEKLQEERKPGNK